MQNYTDNNKNSCLHNLSVKELSTQLNCNWTNEKDKFAGTSSGSFSALPKELVLTIFDTLSLPTLASLRLVCRRFVQLEDNLAWCLFILGACDGNRTCSELCSVYKTNIGFLFKEPQPEDRLKPMAELDVDFYTALFNISCELPSSNYAQSEAIQLVIDNFKEEISSKEKSPSTQVHFALSIFLMDFTNGCDDKILNSLQYAAAGGLIGAQLMLSRLYCDGVLLKKSLKSMQKYLQMAVDQYSERVLHLYQIAGCYERLCDTITNKKLKKTAKRQAELYYQLAASRGYAASPRMASSRPTALEAQTNVVACHYLKLTADEDYEDEQSSLAKGNMLRGPQRSYKTI